MEQKKRTSSTKGKKIQQNNAIAKGLACATCRARKVRCSGDKPACRACLRTARFEGRDLSQVACRYDSRAGGGKKGRKSGAQQAEAGSDGRTMVTLEEEGSQRAEYAYGEPMRPVLTYPFPPPSPYAYSPLQSHPPHLSGSPFLPPEPVPLNQSFTPTPPLSYSSSHSPDDSPFLRSPPHTATSTASSAPPPACYDYQGCGGVGGTGWTFSSTRPPVLPQLSASTSSPHLTHNRDPNGTGTYPSPRIREGGEHGEPSSSSYVDASVGPRYAYTLPPPPSGPPVYYSAYDPRVHAGTSYEQQPAPSYSYPTYSSTSYYAPPHPPPGTAPTPPPHTHSPVPYVSANEASSAATVAPQGYQYRQNPSTAAAPRAYGHDPTFSVPLSARDVPPLRQVGPGPGSGLRLTALPSPGFGPGMSAYALSSSTPSTSYPVQQQTLLAAKAAGTPGFADVDSWLRGLAHP